MRSPLFEIALVLVRFAPAASMMSSLESRRHAALTQVHAARDWIKARFYYPPASTF